MKMDLQIEATRWIIPLMERFLALNPYKSLPTSDPKSIMITTGIFIIREDEVSVSTFSNLVENSGILLQLFPRFSNGRVFAFTGGEQLV